MKRAYLLTAATAALVTLSFAPVDAPLDLPLATALSGGGCAPRVGSVPFLLGSARAYAASVPDPQAPPPLMQGLGATHMPVSTRSPQAQAYFDQGLRMLHGFNHAEAVRAFKEAQRLDPECAMCFWGEAFALGPNINAAMDPEQTAPAYAATRAALAKSDGATEKERALIEAMLVRYTRHAPADRAHLDKAFAETMRGVADAYPDDDLIQTFAVEAMMDTQPWNYWQAGGREPYGYTAEMVRRTEGVLNRNPQHVGAAHLYIHLVEASSNPWRAAKYADALTRLAPQAGHLVHMPAHIYYRVGRFKDSIRANQRAAVADENYIATAGPNPMYRYGYYTHNLHFIMTSAQMNGDAKTALAMAPKLDEALPMEMARAVPMAQPVKAAPWFAKAQFATPDAILAEPQPPAGVDYVTAAWRYARAMAFIGMSEHGLARDEAKAIETLAASGDFAAMNAGGIPTADILKLLATMIEGKVLMAQGRAAEAVPVFDAAVQMQAKIPYMEPPYIYYPVRQSLGAALIAAGEADRAEVEFLHTLTENPNSAYAFWGLSEARKAQGDRAGASAARRLYAAAWGGRRPPTLRTL
jgi:predicted Zn-dependent protease